MVLPTYNGYLIEVFESSAGRWRVRVRHQDGSKVCTTDGEYDALTSDMESPSVWDAVAIAKAMIDVIIAQGVQANGTLH